MLGLSAQECLGASSLLQRKEFTSKTKKGIYIERKIKGLGFLGKDGI